MKVSGIVHSVIQVGSFGVNCTILNDGESAWIVDPGAEAERILNVLKDLSIKAEAILLTHAHFDHIGAINALQTAYPELGVYLNPDDLAILNHKLNQFPPEYPGIKKPNNIHDVRELDALDGFEVLTTPGHTPGGVCYHLPEQHLLLSGDTLFAGSIGRTDLPGGDMETLLESLKKLILLPDETVVVPGHGSFTTIASEKQHNPFLQH